MKGFPSLTAIGVRQRWHPVSLALLMVLLLPFFAEGSQQPATGRKKVPRLTTDDVAAPKTDQPAEEPAADPSGKSDDAGKPDAAKSEAGEVKPSSEELSWREAVQKARERARMLRREMEESELRLTSLRNEMGVSGQNAKDRNDLADELESEGRRFADLRAQAQSAAEDLNNLLEHGRQSGFTEAEGPKPTSADGNPNEQYYRTRFAALNEDLQDAERQVQLYENRVRDLNQRITSNSGSGDNFYNGQLQQERDEAQQKLEQAQQARVKTQNDIEALMEEARRAGVPPGVFR